MAALLADVRFALRLFSRDRAFAIAAISILALGIGATVSVFSVFEAAVLHVLPFPGAERLVSVSSVHRNGDTGAGYMDFADWRRQNTVFEGIAIASSATVDVTGIGTSDGATAERVPAGKATAGFFELLHIPAFRGRFFAPDEDRPGATPVVVLTAAYWERHLGASDAVLGQTLKLNGRDHVIVGVLPPSFAFPGPVVQELWIPLADPNSCRACHQYEAIARLKAGVSVERAQADLSVIAHRLEAEFPATNTGWGVRVRPLHETVVEHSRPTLLLLLGAVGMVLLISCASIATLQLARATARRREMGLRAALGAAQSRLVRQLFTEGLVLAACGGLVGVSIACAGGDLLGAQMVARMKLNVAPHLDLTVLGFAVAATLLSAVVSATLPALHALRSDLISALRASGSASSTSPRERRTLNALVVGEIVLSVVLLVGAGLLLDSLRKLSSVDTGMRTSNLLTFQLGVPRWKYDDATKATALGGAVIDRLRALPGVEAVAATTSLPMSGQYSGGTLEIQGRLAVTGAPLKAKGSAVTSGYFATLGIPLVRGREFLETDRDGPPVAVISETLARRDWSGTDPVGATVKYGGRWRTIVGVAGDVLHNGPTREPLAEVYLPASQTGDFTPSLAVRLRNDPRRSVKSIVQTVVTVDRDVVVLRIRTMDDVIANAVSQPRLAGLLTGVLAALSLVLAMTALYGVMAWAVARRRAEIGVRMALGANRSAILRLIVGQGMRLVIAGIAVGLFGAFLIAPLLARFLYGVQARDASVFMLAALLVTCVAAAANYIPASRAAAVDATISLRSM